MKKVITLLILGASITATAHANPAEDLENLLANRVSQVQNVGKNLRDGASDLVSTAMGFIGVPYRYGGTSASTGFDCSGLVRATYERTLGKVLPRRAADQAAATTPIARSDLRPGDLVFFNTMQRAFSHVGIYVGNGQFVHAPRTGARVRVESLNGSYWASRFQGARRVPGAGSMSNIQAAGLVKVAEEMQ